MAKFELSVIINGCKVYSHSIECSMFDVVVERLKNDLINDVDKIMDGLPDRCNKMVDEYLAKYIDEWKRECEKQ